MHYFSSIVTKKMYFILFIDILAVDSGVDDDSLASDGLVGLSQGSSGYSELLVEELYLQGAIPVNAFGVGYKFTSSTSKIVLGGYDTSIVTDENDYIWIDLIDDFFWTIPIDGGYYGSIDLSLNAESGILDTGTSLMIFESPDGDWDNLWDEISYGFTCGYSSSSGLRACYCSDVTDFDDISFTIGDYIFTVTTDSYIEEESTGICAFYIDGVDYTFSPSGILMGDTFLRNFYIYHDADNSQVGFYMSGSGGGFYSAGDSSNNIFSIFTV